MLLRLAYLGVTNAFVVLRLLPGSERDKDAEILALRHQLAVLQRQLDPGPDRAATTWAQFLHSQAEALLAADFLETLTLAGTRMYIILAVIEHASRRIRILGATAHPTAAWVIQTPQPGDGPRGRAVPGEVPDPRPGRQVPGPVRHTILADANITVVCTGVRIPRTNAVMKRWVRTCRRELLDPALIFNQRHLLHEYQALYNTHRPQQGIANIRPLAPLPEPITDLDRLAHLNIRRHDRLGGILHEYGHAA